MLSLNIETELDPTSVYAAIVATAALAWNIITWLKDGPRLKLSAQPNMVFSDDIDGNKRVVVTAVNNGSKTTTLDNLTMFYWPNYISMLTKTKPKAMVVTNPSLPFVGNSELPHGLEVGKKWQGFILQTKELEEMANKGRLYVRLHHTFSKKPLKVRIQHLGKH